MWLLESLPKLFWWFIFSVVVPATGWFVLIRHDVNTALAQGRETKQKLEAVIDTTAVELRLIRQELGEIKGELKRIK